MATVKEILGPLSKNIISISRDQSVADAISQMVEHEVGALIVVEDDKPVGMFTERDVLKCWTRKGREAFQGYKGSRGDDREHDHRRTG